MDDTINKEVGYEVKIEQYFCNSLFHDHLDLPVEEFHTGI